MGIDFSRLVGFRFQENERSKIKDIIKVYAQMDELLPLVPKLFYILNFENEPVYEYLSKNALVISGYESETIKALGPEKFFFENIHPDHKEYFLDIMEHFLKFYKENPPYRESFHVEYNYKFKHAEEYYINLRERTFVLVGSGDQIQLILSEITRLEDDKNYPVTALYFYVDENNKPLVYFTKGYYSTSCKLNALTKREKEIVELYRKGYSKKKIAETLFISEKTFETHNKHIYKKLRVKSVPELLITLNDNY